MNKDLCANISCVKRARVVAVGGPADDHPPIGEQCQLNRLPAAGAAAYQIRRLLDVSNSAQFLRRRIQVEANVVARRIHLD